MRLEGPTDNTFAEASAKINNLAFLSSRLLKLIAAAGVHFGRSVPIIPEYRAPVAGGYLECHVRPMR